MPHRLDRSRLLPMVVAVGFLVLQLWAAPDVSPSNDTYRYARMTLHVLGGSEQSARDGALRAYCEEDAAWLARRQRVDPVAFASANDLDAAASGCVRDAPGGLPPTSTRYDAIFESRVGLPILATPLVAVLGVDGALRATSVLLTALGGLIARRILRLLEVPGRYAVAGQALYYACPIGWWGSFGLSDGPSVTASMVTLLGAILLLRRRYRLGAALFIASIGAGCLIRYPSAIFVTVAVVLAAGVGLLVDPRHRRPLVLVVALSAVALVGLAATAHALGWPGAADTLQDTFTAHFSAPEVADPWRRLAGLNVAYWSQWSQQQARAPWLVAAVAAGSVALVRRCRAFGLIAVAVALTGFVNQAAHPVASQSDRLLVEVWVAAVLGLPLLLSVSASTERAGAVPRRDGA